MNSTDRAGRNVRRALTLIAVAGLAAALSWNCNKQEEEPVAREPVKYEAPYALDRPLNSTEAETLLAIKHQFGITRDQYWDKQGGVLANEHFESWYPAGKANVLQGAGVLKQMELARANVQSLFGSAPERKVVTICAGDLTVFRAATGRDWWNYALIKGDTISLQSAIDLHTRGLFETAVSREYYEWAIGQFSGHKAPRWVEEGVASYLVGEGAILATHTTEFKKEPPLMSMKDIEHRLTMERERVASRRAAYNAFRMVDRLVQLHGRPSILAFVMACGEEPDVDAAARRIYQKSYEDLVAEARTWPETGAY